MKKIMSTSLGIPPQLITKPLAHALRANAAFTLIEDTRATISKQLNNHELNAALISPLDYAKESSDYRIVPNIAAASHENGILVRFREGVRTISTLAVDPTFASEIILAKIILAESFDIEPKILPMMASPDIMLQKAEAALIAGDEALRSHDPNAIDIVEEWYELTGFPYVHAFWCGREGDVTKEELLALQDAGLKSDAGISEIVRECQPDERETIQLRFGSFSYALEEEAKNGLAEFMRYLYFHGILPDVADLNFYPVDDRGNDDFLSEFSEN